MNPVILIVEDDEDLCGFLEQILTDLHFVVYSAGKASLVPKLVSKVRPNLVILDLGLPDLGGDDVCAWIKENYPNIPVLILTSSIDTKDMVSSFEKGADDYINKPFKMEELLVRIRAKLRVQKRDDPEIRVGDLSLNTETLCVERNDRQISLTYTEFKLLHYLMINANKVLTREQLLSHVWAQDPDIETRVVDVYIGYIRRKLDSKKERGLIYSKRGFGYVLKAFNS